MEENTEPAENPEDENSLETIEGAAIRTLVYAQDYYNKTMEHAYLEGVPQIEMHMLRLKMHMLELHIEMLRKLDRLIEQNDELLT